MNHKLRSPIWYFGGKGILRSKIIPILENVEHTHYVEPFGGGASVLLAKDPAPIETYNDIDENVFNFFMVLSDPDDFEKFFRRVSVLPYSRRLLAYANEQLKTETDNVLRAVWWFVTKRLAFSGSGNKFKYNKTEIRSNSVTRGFISILNLIPAIVERLQRAQIECDTWQNVLKRYDTPDTLFYLDPPYIHATRKSGGYVHEMTDDDHRELVETILTLKGKTVLSGYEHDIYKPLLDNGFTIRRIKSFVKTMNDTYSKASPRIECLYASPGIDLNVT